MKKPDDLPNIVPPMTTPEDSNIDVPGKAHRLLDAWCDRHAYEAICLMWSGLRAINGLSDGWGEFLQALKRLRILAKNENSRITQAETETVQRLIGVVSRAMNSR